MGTRSWSWTTSPPATSGTCPPTPASTRWMSNRPGSTNCSRSSVPRRSFTCLRRLVKDRLGTLDLEQFVEPGRLDIHLVEAGVGGQVPDVAGGEVVQDHDLVPIPEEPLGQV